MPFESINIEFVRFPFAFRVCRLEFLYLFHLQECIYHLSLTFHNLSSFHLKFKVCKFWSSHSYFPKPMSASAI
jgi:hypothetical protein